MAALFGIVRETDVVGRLSPKIVIVMLPMTEGPSSEIALERFSKVLKSKTLDVHGIPFDIQFVGVTTPYDPAGMPTLKALIKTAQNDLQSTAVRLNHLHHTV